MNLVCMMPCFCSYSILNTCCSAINNMSIPCLSEGLAMLSCIFNFGFQHQASKYWCYNYKCLNLDKAISIHLITIILYYYSLYYSYLIQKSLNTHIFDKVRVGGGWWDCSWRHCGAGNFFTRFLLDLLDLILFVHF